MFFVLGFLVLSEKYGLWKEKKIQKVWVHKRLQSMNIKNYEEKFKAYKYWRFKLKILRIQVENIEEQGKITKSQRRVSYRNFSF